MKRVLGISLGLRKSEGMGDRGEELGGGDGFGVGEEV